MGEEALLLPSDAPFDLALSDLILPGLPSPEITRRLHERWPAMKTILMSGYTGEETLRSSAAAAASILLDKPFDMPHLATALRSVLD